MEVKKLNYYLTQLDSLFKRIEKKNQEMDLQPKLKEFQNKVETISQRALKVAKVKIELRPSKVHGRGLFAKSPISKGEVVTFYPGDGIVFYSDPKDRAKHLVFISKEYREKIGEKEELKEMQGHATVLTDNLTLFSHSRLDDNPNYLGHFINDGAHFRDISPKSKDIYLKLSEEKRNCQTLILNELHMAVVATRDIAKDEELFFTYGPDFWVVYDSI